MFNVESLERAELGESLLTWVSDERPRLSNAAVVASNSTDPARSGPALRAFSPRFVPVTAASRSRSSRA